MNIYVETNFVLELAFEEELYNLNSQDAIVLASVISHLQTTKPNKACFPNKNTKDFDSPDVV